MEQLIKKFPTIKNKNTKKNISWIENVPPIQWVPGALSLATKQPGREADHTPPPNAKIKERVELYLHSPMHLHGVVLS
jgi:hypothetical protein